VAVGTDMFNHAEAAWTNDPAGPAGSWHAVQVGGGYARATAVSCPTTTFCAIAGLGASALGSVPVTGGMDWTLLTTTDPTGQADAWTPVSIAGVRSAASVACPSAQRCVATANRTLYASDTPVQAASWTPAAAVPSVLTALACPQMSLCVAGDRLGNLTVGHGPGQPPNNIAKPRIAGDPKVGMTLTADAGSWAGDGPISYRWQWTRDGAAIAGAEQPAYTPTAADAGHSLTVTVTAHNPFGDTPATSDAITVAAAQADNGGAGAGGPGAGSNGGGASLSGGPGSAGVPASVALSVGSIRAARGRLTLRVTCAAGAAACRTSVSLTVVQRLRAGRVIGVAARRTTTTKTVTVGRATATVAAGATRSMTVKLNAAGRKLAGRFGRLPVKVKVIANGASPVVRTATLRR
jgi:hypothetical protein